MRICVISPGVVHAVSRTIAVADQFDEVHYIDMVGNADRNTLESRGIIYHGPEKIDKPIICSRELQRLLKKIKPDAIVSHYAAGDHFFSAIAYGRCPVAAIAMGHDVLYDEGDSFVSPITRLFTRMALRRSHYISAKSRYVARRLESYGVHCPVDVNYWGADLNRYYPGKQSEARRKLRLDENGKIILSARAIEPRLNIHLIVEAFHKVLTNHQNAFLVILGRSKPDYRKQIEETIERLNLENKVCVLGEVSQDDLSQYYRASDVVVSMGHSEGFPNTLLEVMACKVPFVVGRIAPIEELLENDKNAWICEIEPAAIATAVADVLDNREKNQRISDAAYATVKSHADIRKNGISFSNKLKQCSAAYKHRLRVEIVIFRALYIMYRIHRKIVNRQQVKYV